jgi:amino-acid N-acetyltransferase
VTPENPRADVGVAVRRARPEDLDHILVLLQDHRLPTEGLVDVLDQTVVAELSGTVVGCAAIEPYGQSVLLRSVAVANALRGSGVGTQLVEHVLLAAPATSRHAYLLTETASSFFQTLGFRLVARNRLPAAIRGSFEFVEACPATAVAMGRRLRSRAPRDRKVDRHEPSDG